NLNVTEVGDVKDFSPHAAIMVKLSVLNAWAELQVASTKQAYLVQVVQPNLSLLCPLWVSALKEYARVQTETEISNAQANLVGTRAFKNERTEVFDSMYSGLTREVILPYYNKSWLTILEAVASLVQSGNNHIILSLNGNNYESKIPVKPSEDITEDALNDFQNFEEPGDGDGDDFTGEFSSFTEGTNYEKEPAKYFFILFGLCVEALSNTFEGGSRISDVENDAENQKVVIICINALKAFLRPIVAGKIFLEKSVFIELINLFDRLVLTEGFQVQLDIIQIIKNIIQNYGSIYICEEARESTTRRNESDNLIDYSDNEKNETILFYV
ncbi:12978_t:CDS:2, partial [Acaulospora morrowiae]